jgi:hypothetical protein
MISIAIDYSVEVQMRKKKRKRFPTPHLYNQHSWWSPPNEDND